MTSEANESSDFSRLAAALGEEGEADYRRLLKVANDSKRHFALYPLETDLPTEYRVLFRKRLEEDLSAQGLSLRLDSLNSGNWQQLILPTLEPPSDPDEILLLLGLALTPDSDYSINPPAFSLINYLRESLSARFPIPHFFWCSPELLKETLILAPDLIEYFLDRFLFTSRIVETSLEEAMPAALTPEEEADDAISWSRALRDRRISLANLSDGTLEHASAQLDVAEAIVLTHIYAKTEQVEEALPLLESAREFLSLRKNTEGVYEYARSCILKGDVFTYLPSINKTDNILFSIKCYEEALKIYTPEAYPQERGWTYGNMARSYLKLRGGEIGDKSDEIRCYEEALKTLTEESFPIDWATVLNRLGVALTYGASGNKETNIKSAIFYLEASLRVRTVEEFPEQWATTQKNLGNAYISMPNELEKNNRIGIEFLKVALNIYTKEIFPYDWARLQVDMGTAFENLSKVCESENADIALKCYEAAHEVFTREIDPETWATIQAKIAQFYIALKSGNRSENVRNAILRYGAALLVFENQVMSLQLIFAHVYLGIAYWTLKENVTSKAHYENAIRIENAIGSSNGYSCIEHAEYMIKICNESQKPKGTLNWLKKIFHLSEPRNV